MGESNYVEMARQQAAFYRLPEAWRYPPTADVLDSLADHIERLEREMRGAVLLLAAIVATDGGSLEVSKRSLVEADGDTLERVDLDDVILFRIASRVGGRVDDDEVLHYHPENPFRRIAADGEVGYSQQTMSDPAQSQKRGD